MRLPGNLPISVWLLLLLALFAGLVWFQFIPAPW